MFLTLYTMNNLPEDVIRNNLFKNDLFAICIDPKHSKESYHYTIWALNEIKDISEITKNIIDKLDNFIKILQEKNINSIYKCFRLKLEIKKLLHLII